MELEKVLLKRRSIRKFKDEEVSNEEIQKILYFAMTAPSACNKQPWEFHVIKNEETLAKIKKASMFSRYNAPLAIVVSGNLKKALPFKMADYWIQDCSSAISYMLLEITNLGLGAVWCGLHPQKTPVKKVRELLSLDENIVPLGLILIGRPNEEKGEKPKFDEKKVHYVE